MAGLKQVEDYSLRVFVKKLDPTGALVWEREYSNYSGEDSRGASLRDFIQVDSNEFALLASLSGGNGLQPWDDEWYTWWIINIDSTGTIVYDYSHDPEEKVTSTVLRKTDSNDYLLTASAFSPLNPWEAAWSPLIYSLDSTYGNVDWKHPVEDTASFYSLIYDLQFQNSGQWITTGRWLEYSEFQDDLIFGPCHLLIGESGVEHWRRCDTFPYEVRPEWEGKQPFYDTKAVSTVVFPSGSIFSAGTVDGRYLDTRSYGLLMKIDRYGCIYSLCSGRLSSMRDVQTQNSNGNLYLQPNPARDRLIISTGQHHYDTVIRVFDMAGNIIMEKQVDYLPVEGLELDVSRLSCGIYVCHLNGKNNRNISGQFVIVR